MGNRIDRAQGEDCIADDDLVDFFSQAFFFCSAAGYDAGRDGEEATAIAPPDRFEMHEGWPPVNRKKWRAFTRQMLTLLTDRRAYVVKTRLANAREESEPSCGQTRNAG